MAAICWTWRGWRLAHWNSTSPKYQFSNNVGLTERTIVLPATLPNSVTYSLNGINITGSRDGELALSPSVAAVDQFKVQQSFLMPDEGVNPAVVNIVTKSGSNRFHGDAFEFLRNGSLDARSFFATGPEDLKRNQFGVALGGPIRKDRVWFHGFYEGLRQLRRSPPPDSARPKTCSREISQERGTSSTTRPALIRLPELASHFLAMSFP